MVQTLERLFDSIVAVEAWEITVDRAIGVDVLWARRHFHWKRRNDRTADKLRRGGG